MKGGSFRDLDDAKPRAARKNAAGPTGTGVGAPGVGVAAPGSGNGAASPLYNYSTFHGSDPGVQSLMRTSDRIEQSKKVIAESEQVAKHVMVDLELQRSQLVGMKGMANDTTNATVEVKSLLQIIADRSYRRKVFLWTVIVALAITDIVVFYLLFIRR